MDGNIRLSATVISFMGENSNKDDFYFNGNFSNCHNTQSIQCSFEKASNNYIFAISDSLGIDNGELDSISAIREIKRYHESSKKQQFSLENITEKVYEAVQLSSNLVYSRSIIASQNSSALTGFSSVIIDNNRATIMNLGNNGAFLFRQGVQKAIFHRNDSKKDEKLKMLGISPNTAEIFNDTEKILKIAEQESKTKIKLSSSFEIEEGDIIFLCSDGLLDNVNKSRIESVIDSGLDSSKMASILFQEAMKEGLNQSITLMVISVDEIKNIDYVPGHRKLNEVDYDNQQEDDKEEESNAGHSIVNYILGFICVLVISGVLFMGYLIFKNSGILTAGGHKAETTQSSTITADNSESTVSSSADTQQSDSTDSQASSSKQQAADNQNSSSDKPSKQNTDPNANKSGNSEYDEYTVQKGDTLSSISNKYYGSPNKYDAIIKYNNLKNENSIFLGQVLKIPKVN